MDMMVFPWESMPSFSFREPWKWMFTSSIRPVPGYQG